MFEYAVDQTTFTIGGVRIGGRPGMVPTVLIPSIFYAKDRLVLNVKTGEIDRKETERTLANLVELTEKTGISTMLDVVATTSEAMESYLRYLIDATDFPLLIDGSDSLEVNTAGIEYAKNAGFIDRVVINSLSPNTKDELYKVIQETGLSNALLLTFDTPSMTSSLRRVEVADLLIRKAQEACVTNIMIDTGVMDLLTLGIACKTQQLLKSKYGYPVGNGAHNAINTWSGLVPKFGKETKKSALVGANIMPIAQGADFVLMGPAKHASMVYPCAAMVDVALSGLLMEERIRPERPHPRFLIG